MKNIQRKLKVASRPLLLFCFLCWISHPILAAQSRPYKIGIVHSYEKNYYDAERYRYLLEKELTANHLTCEIKEFFMNCDELTYHHELARASFFIDEFDKWGADAIAIFNNQAIYSFLKCENPKLRTIPVVFSGVYHPDEDLIRGYPNVTGFVDIPDYTSTVRMIENLMGKCRIVVMSGSGMIDNEMWLELANQCDSAGIETYDEDVFSHIWAHRVIKAPDKEDKDSFFNEQIDTTVVMRLMSEKVPLRTIQQTARGSETYLMLTARTYNTQDAPEFFANPSFGVINEGFGSNSKMLGGYFTPLETQMKEMAGSIALRLSGQMPEKQIVQCQKEYVLSWEAMQRYGIPVESIPAEYHIMYIPFFQRYHSYIVAGILLAGLFLCAIIVYLSFSLVRERKRKKEALRNLLYEHKTLKLAIEGGTTYAWRREKGNMSFDSHFYTLIGHTQKFITPEQILGFVHPDDRDRFNDDFLQDNSHDNRKEQYRCKFGGDYQWWEFRYSFIPDQKDAAVVTGLLQNIQEVKDREKELIEARNIAEQAELKQSFLNNISHEIRTPLNAIVGFSNLLVSSPDMDEEEKKEFVELINTNNNLLINLINDILELSRIQSGTISFTMRDEDLRTLLNSYYQTFSIQIKPELTFIRDFPEEDVTLHTDAMRLQQVISNLLTNANKFTDSGYIKLGYRLSPNKKSVHIFVEDSGKGIGKSELEMIFSRFYKHDEFAQGTGLGLSISQGITERMNGHIEATSEEGKGSRFTIILPLHKRGTLNQ